MDLEVQKAIRTIVRCGPEIIRSAISTLRENLLQTEGKSSRCDFPGAHAPIWGHVSGNIASLKDVRIEGDNIVCIFCRTKVDSSLFDCKCDRPGWHPDICPDVSTYMIGDRDFMRIRCRKCDGLVEGPERYPASSRIPNSY